MSTILPNVETFRRVFLPTIVADLDSKYAIAHRNGKGFHTAWLNAAGDLPVNISGHTLTVRDVIAGLNGFESAKDIDWRSTSVEGIPADTLNLIWDEVESVRPEWFHKVKKVYVKRAPSASLLAELGLA